MLCWRPVYKIHNALYWLKADDSLHTAEWLIQLKIAIEYQVSFRQADSFSRTPPLLYSPINITNIIQSLNLTDAIIDDSFSTVPVS